MLLLDAYQFSVVLVFDLIPLTLIIHALRLIIILFQSFLIIYLLLPAFNIICLAVSDARAQNILLRIHIQILVLLLLVLRGPQPYYQISTMNHQRVISQFKCSFLSFTGFEVKISEAPMLALALLVLISSWHIVMHNLTTLAKQAQHLPRSSHIVNIEHKNRVRQHNFGGLALIYRSLGITLVEGQKFGIFSKGLLNISLHGSLWFIIVDICTC